MPRVSDERLAVLCRRIREPGALLMGQSAAAVLDDLLDARRELADAQATVRRLTSLCADLERGQIDEDGMLRRET